MNDDRRYKDVIDSLKGLQQVKAPGNFDTELFKKINSQSNLEKQNFWGKIFTPSRLVPSAALAVTAVILFFFLFDNEDVENPLLAEPRIREDVFITENISQVPLDIEAGKEELSNDERKLLEQNQKSGQNRVSAEDSNIAEYRSNNFKLDNNTAYTSVDYSIDKKGLNFRQVNLSEEEQQQLGELRERFRALLKAKKE